MERKKDGPPCSTCLPEKLKINNDALMVFRLCMSQVIISPMGGAISINVLAVTEVMNLYNIKNQRDCFERVLFLFDEARNGQGDECN